MQPDSQLKVSLNFIVTCSYFNEAYFEGRGLLQVNIKVTEC